MLGRKKHDCPKTWWRIIIFISILTQVNMHIEKYSILGSSSSPCTLQVSENQKFVGMNKECKVDKAMCLVLLDCYNGKTIFLDKNFISSNTFHLFTDAA